MLIPADHPVLALPAPGTGTYRTYPKMLVTMPRDGQDAVWTAVCNGVSVFAVSGADPEAQPHEHSRSIAAMFAPDKLTGSTTVGELRALGVDPSYEAKPCDKCKGAGTVYVRDCGACGGDGERECEMGHWHDCDDCDGDGQVYVAQGEPDAEADVCPKCKGIATDSPQYVQVRIGRALLNAVLLRRVLATVPDDERVLVYVPNGLDATAIYGKDWRALVMPMRADHPPEPTKPIPELALGPLEAA